MFKIAIVRNVIREIKKKPQLAHINSGGCAVFAAILAKKLQNSGVEYKIAVFTYDPNIDIHEARMNVTDPSEARQWNASKLHFVHVMVEFTHRGREYRADGKTLESTSDVWHHYHRADGELTLKEIDKLAAVDRNWNSSFDRDNIPMLKRIINKQFAAIG